MPLHPQLAAVRRNLPRVARALGFDARVTSAYRSRAKQAWLYNRWLQGLQSYPVAPPGTSDHEKGLALDVVSTNLPQLVSLLTSAGLRWAGEADPVHFALGPGKSQASAKKGIMAIGEQWEEDVGSSIPGFLDLIPGLGQITSVVRNPIKEAKSGLETLLTVILGPL